MRKLTIALTCGVAGLVLSNVTSAATASYGEDRAQIEELPARYLFALDFHDRQLCASTFTPDGILDYGEGDVKGREAIIKVIANMPGNASGFAARRRETRAAPSGGTPPNHKHRAEGHRQSHQPI